MVFIVCKSVYVCYGFRGYVFYWGFIKFFFFCFIGIFKIGGFFNSGIIDD